MPCYQPTNLPPGVTTTGRPSYRTEAECLQACQEGACCEGTTCTVKPQCQCQCTTGRCCGPDTTTAGGTTWKTCRNETKAQCDARGGVFQCGVSCTTGVIGDAAGSTGGSVCLSGTGDIANAGPVFKGVGTVCSPNPCDLCDQASISVATSGTASGLWALFPRPYVCPSQSYSVSASGGGSLTRNDSFILAKDICDNASVIEKCGFAGTFSAASGGVLTVAVKFFLVGSDVRYAVSCQVTSTSASTISACSPPPFSGGTGSPVDGGVGIFRSCSSVVGQASQSGGLLVNLSSLPPLVISSGGSFNFAAQGGSVTLSFNPLP